MKVFELISELLRYGQNSEVFIGLDVVYTDAFKIAKVRSAVLDKCSKGPIFDVGPSVLSEDWVKDEFEPMDIIDGGAPAFIIYPITEEGKS